MGMLSAGTMRGRRGHKGDMGSQTLQRGNRLHILGRFSRRTLIIAAVIVVALLALIIGLSVGLTLRNKHQNLPLPTNHGGPYTGDLTYYGPGLGACGVTSSDSDMIVSISHFVFDAAQKGSDPNANPLCGLKIRARLPNGNASVDMKVVDRCTGCQPTDLDVSPGAFSKLADLSLGRVKVEWAWLENTGT